MTTTSEHLVTLTTYINRRDAERLKAVAKAEDRTLAAELRRAISAHLKANENPSSVGDDPQTPALISH